MGFHRGLERFPVSVKNQTYVGVLRSLYVYLDTGLAFVSANATFYYQMDKVNLKASLRLWSICALTA